MVGHHFVAVFGGAVAGSEAAYQLAQRGFRVVVFEQNTLPYGKIEDGLPKWHEKLRDKEEAKINEKIGHPNVLYVPGVKLGQDVDFDDLVQNWGFTAILLATGAWRDRPLPIDGIDPYVNKGLYYQNPLVYWFNHKHEPGYDGPTFELTDDAMVIGGGLASLDVVKILMMESVEKALAERGHKVDMFTLDRSIAKVLEGLDLTLADLNIKGCRLFYRRRDLDMPLSPLPTDTPEQLEKAQTVRKKILDNFLKKYLFEFIPCHAPVDKIVENDKLTGIVFQETKIEDGRVVAIPGSEKSYHSPLVISSIGSLPEKIESVPWQGQVFKVDQDNCCKLEGHDNVFALGNAVTGRGNIIESMKHGKSVTIDIMDKHLNWEEKDYENWFRGAEKNVEAQVDAIAEHIERQDFIPAETVQSILDGVEALQKKAGYDGDFMSWVEKNLPIRLEQLLEAESE
ncbi:MAG: FAD-dependent oxidoreductase [Cyclobacteriaceae bacterium]